MLLEPSVDLLQGHEAVLTAVDGKLDHGHVGEGRLYGRAVLGAGNGGGAGLQKGKEWTK